MNWTLITGVITGFIIPILGYHLHGYEKTKENLYFKIHELEKEVSNFRLEIAKRYINKTDIEKQFDRLFDELEKIRVELKDHAKTKVTTKQTP